MKVLICDLESYQLEMSFTPEHYFQNDIDISFKKNDIVYSPYNPENKYVIQELEIAAHYLILKCKPLDYQTNSVSFTNIN